MEIVVDSRKENKLLEREEIHFRVKYEGSTPSRKKIKEALKGHLGVGGYIVIHKIEPLFGMKEAKVYAKVYSDESKARKIESDHLFKRGGSAKKEEVKEEAKEGAKVEEETKEEKKEGDENAEA